MKTHVHKKKTHSRTSDETPHKQVVIREKGYLTNMMLCKDVFVSHKDTQKAFVVTAKGQKSGGVRHQCRRTGCPVIS